MAEDKLTIRLTDDQQKQIQGATGKKVTALNITGYVPSALTEQDLDKVTGGKFVHPSSRSKTIHLIEIRQRSDSQQNRHQQK